MLDAEQRLVGKYVIWWKPHGEKPLAGGRAGRANDSPAPALFLWRFKNSNVRVGEGRARRGTCG